MRLINVRSFDIVQFSDATRRPPYAILSHRWTSEEISYRDLVFRKDEFLRCEAETSAGWMKMQQFCRLANQEGYEWVWVDTCSIDKSSSAELSEAINSMFEWYHDAQCCYVYLHDVSVLPSPRESTNRPPGSESFSTSEWFSRGWTLQELVAPRELRFVNKQWQLSPETRKSLAADLSKITGIRIAHLRDGFQGASIAEIMSWASSRRTTRIEDTAYCLMGLFQVNMPLLYGEGPRAFLRLQLEIIKQSDDETIFAWHSQCQLQARTGWTGLLAVSPLDFRNCRFIYPATFDRARGPYAMTNQGLRFEVLLQRDSQSFLLPLNCTDIPYNPANPPQPQRFCMLRLENSWKMGFYGRVVYQRIHPNDPTAAESIWLSANEYPWFWRETITIPQPVQRTLIKTNSRHAEKL